MLKVGEMLSSFLLMLVELRGELLVERGRSSQEKVRGRQASETREGEWI